MRRTAVPFLTVLLAACAARAPASSPASGLVLPSSVVVLEAATGADLDAGALLRRMDAADVVLLGELHDNATHHAVRAQLLGALRREPAVVFEQLPESAGPIPPPAAEDLESWLQRIGFDRESWRWPLHRPVIEAAIVHGRSIWGSGVSRERLRAVVREGEPAADAHLRDLLQRAPLSEQATALLDRELVEGHCGQLPEAMRPGMRAAQTVRDAAMANALVRAAETGQAVLIAGNGHVRRDIAVPRILDVTAPGRTVLVVGFLERSEGGALPDAAARGAYDVVVVTPRTARQDPCADLRIR